MMDTAGTTGTLPRRHNGRGSKSNAVQGRGGEGRRGKVEERILYTILDPRLPPASRDVWTKASSSLRCAHL